MVYFKCRVSMQFPEFCKLHVHQLLDSINWFPTASSVSDDMLKRKEMGWHEDGSLPYESISLSLCWTDMLATGSPRGDFWYQDWDFRPCRNLGREGLDWRPREKQKLCPATIQNGGHFKNVLVYGLGHSVSRPAVQYLTYSRLIVVAFRAGHFSSQQAEPRKHLPLSWTGRRVVQEMTF